MLSITDVNVLELMKHARYRPDLVGGLQQTSRRMEEYGFTEASQYTELDNITMFTQKQSTNWRVFTYTYEKKYGG